ncbi:tol-pal system-associated acyl-CoA thioesterase [Spectribacter hydrogenoxidans]|uniref:Tol-pal system-associated acyl-CoA thioesterase n=1 Tax=Spectribacter hydrogenoxidans TaxID=3075608 RepID=A0ABU3C272_9GAMM|nr:tol-pal system-associated acyl-CoA thioesterase [Salinisphaera sp. W335]MDT0635655.1 tol-pal system-associated acyl-CoA thioesterase [Salinisphaera sp. W335]
MGQANDDAAGDGGVRRHFEWPIRVYYEDTDASGVVYHANYLRYFERARTEWLRALGFDQARLATELGAVFTVVSATLAFRRPARLDDRLIADVVVSEVRRASLSFEQTLRREREYVASGQFRIACVDTQGFRPRAVPSVIVADAQGD